MKRVKAAKRVDAGTEGSAPWRNRERTLVLCSRGCSYRERHLMQDLRDLMPHARGESKIDKKEDLRQMNEIALLKNCTKCIYFENRKRADLYMWMVNVPKGPSAKFLVHNVHTMGELRLSGNCLRGSRPVLSFDARFDSSSHMKLIKEMLLQTMGTPRRHPRSQPFFDHVMTFSLSDDQRIWMRNYQIVDETTQQMEEIGPRLVLELVKVFEGSFGGAIIYENGDYTSPNTERRMIRMKNAYKYDNRVDATNALKHKKANLGDSFATDAVFDEVFATKQLDIAHLGRPSAKTVKRKNTARVSAKLKKQRLAAYNSDGSGD